MSSVALHTAVYVTTSSLKQLGWHFWYGSEIQDDYQQLLYSVQIVHEWYLECPNQSFHFIMNWQDGLCHRTNIRIWCLRGNFFFIHFSETTKTSLECFMDGPVENAKFFVPLVKWRLSSTKHIFYSCWSEIREWPPLPEKFKRTLLKIILSKVYSEKLQTHCPQMIL